MRKLAARVGKDGAEIEIAIERLDDGRVKAVIDGVERIVEVRPLENGAMWLLADGRSFTVDVDPGKDGELLVEVAGLQAGVRLYDPRLEQLKRAAVRPKGSGGAEDIRAPMPGKIVKVMVKPGDRVQAAQGLVVVEAMKMENELRAPREAQVKVVHVTEGQAVEAQEPLVTLE
jgi:biotin carboxyl carrier protein